MTASDRATKTVGDLMTCDLLAVTPEDRVGRARDLMLTMGVNALPVMEGNDVVGIVTSTDMIDNWPEGEAITTAMTPVPTLIDTRATLAEAAELMRSHRIHHLLVNDDVEVIGILSSFDLLSVLIEGEVA